MCSIDLHTIRSIVSRMSAPVPRILALNPLSLHDVLDDVTRVGAAIGREADAAAVKRELQQRVSTMHEYVAQRYANDAERVSAKPNVCMLEWVAPLFPGGHWTPDIIQQAGTYIHTYIHTYIRTCMHTHSYARHTYTNCTRVCTKMYNM